MMRKPLFVLFILLAICSCRKQSFEERVTENIAELNKKLPIRLDSLSTMDSMVFRPDTYTLQTFYTIEGMADNDSVLTEEFRNTLGDNLLSSLKGNIQYRKYKERDFVLEYLYYSRSTGRLLMNFSFTPDDYR